jgi:hypothetical protein
MMTRISWKKGGEAEYKSFHSVLSVLSYMLKVRQSGFSTRVCIY